jgi:hypothetical protein
MKSTRMTLWIAFTAALGLGYGCGGTDYNNGGSGSTPLALDGKTYGEKYTCNEQFGGVPPTTCPDLNEVDEIIFASTGPDTFEVRDVPDSGFVLTGTLSGNSFVWTATSPLGYTEAGTWTFASSGATFSGSSHYVANDLTYAGDCNENGSLGAGTIPPNPPSPSGCP